MFFITGTKKRLDHSNTSELSITIMIKNHSIPTCRDLQGYCRNHTASQCWDDLHETTGEAG